MSAPKDGGPAFPNDAVMGKCETADGMTLRDYFAAKASDEDIAEIIGQERDFNTPAITRAQARFIHADAMLKERAK